MHTDAHRWVEGLDISLRDDALEIKAEFAAFERRQT
jgi:hypothetical protein